ncbi:LacI family DNA-binding transcriptional regulator [Murimonas intestini]|uniref:LacI family DNA-binding transcriptional regulator n=1 Tax=Murimonas intestini TaxID=1337051 RepID=UPI0011DDD920|nr:LacI family DNA-binding transcriptional regulator [Murimonas intestini]
MARPTLKNVAERAGVSVATVSYVLNGKKKYISEETKERIYKAVEELDYIPDMNARGLAARDTKLIGVVIPQTEPGSELMFHNPFYGEILSSIEYQARLNGYQLIISGMDVDANYMRLAKERNLDGIIAIGMYPDELYEQFKKIDIPVVLVDSYCKDKFFHNIRIDDTMGSYEATKHVIGCGHRKIAFLSGMLKENGVMKKRFLGYKKALEEAGIAFCEEYIYEGEVDYKSGEELARLIAEKQQGITAVIAAADIQAIGAIKGFYEAGINVPEDMSVMGFDNLEMSQFIIPGLTTVGQNIALKGERAVELLVENMDNPDMEKQEEILPVMVVERGSIKQI